jgi:hypothetical protein
MHTTSGNTIKDALIVGERHLHNLQTETLLYRPDEHGRVTAISECDAPTDIRLPHVSRLPAQRRLLIDYLLSGRRVFFWLWRHAELVHCPYCLSRDIEPRDVCDREVVDLDETILLVYRTYGCNNIRHPGRHGLNVNHSRLTSHRPCWHCLEFCFDFAATSVNVNE